MKNISKILINITVTVLISAMCFVLCLILQNTIGTDSLIPAIFVLGAFLTSLITEGYTYGIISAFLSVLAVDFAFEFPYFKLNFTITENLVSAIIMIIIAFVTCTLTTKLKKQEAFKAEGEKEKMRANLLRAVSHDLRTPLTTIYGASSAILENKNDFSEEQKMKMLQSIKEDAAWLTRMVENLLSITRLDGENVKILKTSTVLDEFIDSVLIKFKKHYPNQEVFVDLPDEFITIPMDAMLVEQVVINMLENAVCHAEGMTELCINVFTLSNKVIFEIKDNGCGIDNEKLKSIFTGYYNSENTSSDCKRSNAGIGLSVCSAIIKAHGGDIKAENQKGGGAVFRFTLDMEEQINE